MSTGLWRRLIFLMSGAVVAQGAFSVVQCVNPKPFPPCPSCTASHRLRALRRACGNGSQFVRFKRRGPDQLTVDPQPTVGNFRLGNQLSLFFTNLGLAVVANLPIEPKRMKCEDVVLRYQLPPNLNSTISEYLRTRELEQSCRSCPLSLAWPHECAGLWRHSGARHLLRRQLRSLPVPRDLPDVVIHFRCSAKSLAHRMYRMLPLDYYLAALEGEVNASSSIGILIDPQANEVPCCMSIARTLMHSLRRIFRCEVKRLTPSSTGRDFALLMRAKILVCSLSTFGFWAAVATSGRAYFPVSRLIAGGQPLCLPAVRWVRGTTRLWGDCSASSFKAFISSPRASIKALESVRKELGSIFAGVPNFTQDIGW